MKRLILTSALLAAGAAPMAVADPPLLKVAPAELNFGTRSGGPMV